MEASDVDNTEREVWSIRSYLTDIQRIVPEELRTERAGCCCCCTTAAGVHVGFIAVPVPQPRIRGRRPGTGVLDTFTVHIEDNSNEMIPKISTRGIDNGILVRRPSPSCCPLPPLIR